MSFFFSSSFPAIKYEDILLKPSFTICFPEEAVMKEKIWSLVAQNEPSLVPLSMVSFVHLYLYVLSYDS